MDKKATTSSASAKLEREINLRRSFIRTKRIEIERFSGRFDMVRKSIEAKDTSAETAELVLIVRDALINMRSVLQSAEMTFDMILSLQKGIEKDWKKEFLHVETKTTSFEEHLRLALGVGKDAPVEEVWDRAKKIGELYDTMIHSGKVG